MILVRSSKLEKTGCITAFHSVPGLRPRGKGQQNLTVSMTCQGPQRANGKLFLPKVLLNEVMGSTDIIS